MSMEKLDSLSAYELAKRIDQILGIKANVKKISDKSSSFFEFDDGDMSVYCSCAPVREIAQIEKGCNETHASYVSVLKLANEALDDDDISEAVKYCVFAILHEFGHFVFFQNVSETERREKVDERNHLLSAAKERLKSDAARGLLEIQSRSRYESSYRSIPFERIADEFARANIASVVEFLVLANGVD